MLNPQRYTGADGEGGPAGAIGGTAELRVDGLHDVGGLRRRTHSCIGIFTSKSSGISGKIESAKDLRHLTTFSSCCSTWTLEISPSARPARNLSSSRVLRSAKKVPMEIASTEMTIEERERGWKELIAFQWVFYVFSYLFIVSC